MSFLSLVEYLFSVPVCSHFGFRTMPGTRRLESAFYLVRDGKGHESDEIQQAVPVVDGVIALGDRKDKEMTAAAESVPTWLLLGFYLESYLVPTWFLIGSYLASTWFRFDSYSVPT